MTIPLIESNETSSAKISDLNAVIRAINAELATLGSSSAPPGASASNVWAAVDALSANEKKRLWKTLRDGS